MGYYNQNSREFIENTKSCDMSAQYAFFEKHLNNAKTILDIGFGSGRDSLYFSEKYEVYSIDPTKEFCDYAQKIGLKNVYQVSVQNMKFKNSFDGIWACASLLHVFPTELELAFTKCSEALKQNGVMYCSFRYGDFQGDRNGRFYIDLTESTILAYLKKSKLKVVETSITFDVRPDRKEKWLNCILAKE